MAITAEQMATWCRGILGDDPNVPKQPVEAYLTAIPPPGDRWPTLPAARRSWCAATWTPSPAPRWAKGTSACGR